MISVLVLNLLAAALAIVLPNEWLKLHAYWLYGFQAVTFLPYLLRRANAARHLFVPSLFTLVYFLVNQVLGAYLVPRYFGWNKNYGAVSLAITSYNAIIPYLLLANLALFLLTCGALGRLAGLRRPAHAAPPPATGPGRRLLAGLAEVLCLLAFLAVSLSQVLGAFSLQLALMVCHLPMASRRGTAHRLAVYGFYLAAMLAFSFDSKRQIVIVLFLILFLEARRSGALLRLRLRSLVPAGVAAALFVALVLAASVLRGYGGFQITSPVQAVAAIPRYITSDVFIDGVVDNLELNYGYGSAITPMAMTLRGELPYQYGASLWKILFLPIPRSLFPDKPESALQIYTRSFDPGLWAQAGSLPVAFQADMFMNFGFLGLLPFALILGLVNRWYVGFHTARDGSLVQRAMMFLSITVLILARGSGFELYVLTFLLGLPVLVVAAILAQTPDALAVVGRAWRPAAGPMEAS